MFISGTTGIDPSTGDLAGKQVPSGPVEETLIDRQRSRRRDQVVPDRSDFKGIVAGEHMRLSPSSGRPDDFARDRRFGATVPETSQAASAIKNYQTWAWSFTSTGSARSRHALVPFIEVVEYGPVNRGRCHRQSDGVGYATIQSIGLSSSGSVIERTLMNGRAVDRRSTVPKKLSVGADLSLTNDFRSPIRACFGQRRPHRLGRPLERVPHAICLAQQLRRPSARSVEEGLRPSTRSNRRRTTSQGLQAPRRAFPPFGVPEAAGDHDLVRLPNVIDLAVEVVF